MARAVAFPIGWLAADVAPRVVVAALVVVVGAGYVGTVACGRADNGDFLKVAGGYVEKPSGFSTAWPPPASAESGRRFFAAWLPAWAARADRRLRPEESKRTSGHLFWFPGAIVARAVGGATLDLRWVALPARLVSALFASAGVLVLGASAEGLLAAGLFAAAATDIGYLSFLNTWFEEGPCLPYALALFVGLALWARGRPRLGFGIVVGAGAGLTTCRSVNAAFGVVLVLSALVAPRRVLAPIAPRVRAAAAALLVLATVTSGFVVARYPDDPLVNPFNGIFYGALTFVDDPGPHLARLGLGPEARAFVGRPIFVGDAHDFAYAHPAAIRFAHALGVYAREPWALARAAWFAIGELHDTRLAYLPTHAEDVRPGWPEIDLRQRTLASLHGRPFWSMVWLVAIAVVAARLLRTRHGAPWGSATLALLACALAGTLTAILGDGRQEIAKHLWTANLLLDLAGCAAVAGWCERA